MSDTPELVRQVVGVVDEKLHVVNHRLDPNTGTYVPEEVSGGTGSEVVVTNVVDITSTTQLPAALGGSGGLQVEVIASSGGGLTDTELRATPVDVDATGSTVVISGTVPVSGTFWQATQPVSGPVTDTQLRATPVPVDGTVAVSNFPATQPVSGPLTDTQLRASAVPVSDGAGSLTVDGTVAVSNFPATQPVSGPLTDTQLRASAVPVSAASLPLPSGAATSANQSTELASLASIDSHIVKANTDAVTISAALPAGTNALGKVMAIPVNMVSVNFTAEAVAGIIAETAITLTHSIGNAATATGTSYTPTSGKNLFIHTLLIAWVATTTTANTCRLRLRVNASGAAVVTSPLQFSCRIAWESATFIANEGEFQTISIPGGLVVPNGGGIMATLACVAANGTLDITALGYEYTP